MKQICNLNEYKGVEYPNQVIFLKQSLRNHKHYNEHKNKSRPLVYSFEIKNCTKEYYKANTISIDMC